MYILTSLSSGQKEPFVIQASKKPAFISAVEDWMEAVEIEGESADEIRNAVTELHNTTEGVNSFEVDGLRIEVYHTYQ